MSEEEMEKEENLEHEVIDRLKLLNELDFDRAYLDESYIDAMLKARNIILKLYNKEKGKNKWKPISEYNREKYDWVLIKYYDGDYECVPEVAEQRCDGKWYTSEREIPFKIKYFFDMQELLEE